MPKQSMQNLKTKKYLQKASWSEWIKVFNRFHNPTMFTSVGVVEVKTYEKKKKSNGERKWMMFSL